MKLINYFLLFTLLSTHLYSQWHTQHPLGQDESFNACSFLDTLNGWVCGANGIIIHTSDGGSSWVKQNSQTEISLQDIKFHSLTSGWAIGSNGIILHTTDGGLNWMNKSRNNTDFCLSVSPVNDSSTWITGKASLILFSSDHGDTWNSKTFLGDYTLNTCKFFNDKKGWIVGGWWSSPFTGGAISYTINGGTSWLTSYNGNSIVRGLSFAGEKFGWAVGDPSGHFSSINGGATWNSIQFFQSKWMDKICFADSLHGWACTLKLPNTIQNIYRTSDGGNSWSSCYSSDYQICGFSYVDKNTGWMVGAKGTILKTTDGGEHWSLQYSNNLTSNSLDGVFFLNKDTGWAGGYWGNLLKTTNGGIKWNKISISLYNWINALYFKDSFNGWAACANKIIKTTDGGKTWINQLTGIDSWLSAIHFSDSLNGWAVGEDPTDLSGEAYKTTNGGTTWELGLLDSINALESVYFIDKNKGFIVGGYGKVYRTTDAGGTWQLETFPINDWLMSVHFSSSLKGLIAGYDGEILRTIDGGNTWENYSTGTGDKIKSLYMLNEYDAWVVGENGICKRTADGGISWTSISTHVSNNLSSVIFVDSSAGWAVGSSGLIIKYGYNTVTEVVTEIPTAFILFQNYPNPFNPATRIRYSVPKEILVNIKVYDILGKEVATLVNESKKQGTYEVNFNASAFSNGVYFYRMIADGNVVTRKALLIK